MLGVETFGRPLRNPLDGVVRVRHHRVVGPLHEQQGAPRTARHFVIAGAVAAILAAAISAYAAVESAQTQREISTYNRKMAERAALLQRQQAEAAARTKAREFKSIMAAQRARLGAAGVLPSEGSPLLVQQESAEQAALEVARIKWAGEVGASDYESQAILEGYAGKRALREGYLRAGASLLTGISTASSIYAQGYGSGRGGSLGYTTNRPPDAPGFYAGRPRG